MKGIDLDKIEYIVEHLREPQRLLDSDFQEWLAKEDNFRIFNIILENREAYIYYEFMNNIDESYELKKCISRLHPRSKRIYYWSSVAACILLLISFLFFFTNKENVSETTFVDAVSVSKKCAELILADGKRVELKNKTIEIKNVQGAVIKNDSLLGLFYKGDKQQTSENVAEYHTLKIPAGTDYYVQLGDGTKIWLNCESTLKYPVNFGKKERKVYLDGEAYFEVKKAEKWPFIVTTEKMDILVTGTEFNVKSYARESVIHTTLVHGKVLVNQQLLKPSQQFSMNKETQEININTVDTKIYTGWVDGMFVFKRQRLENVMSDLARWYKIEVFYTNSVVKDIRFSGNLGRYEKIDDLLHIIEALDKVSIVRKGNIITISNK